MHNTDDKKNANPTLAENKMGVMPIPKLLLNMSLPMMLSMLTQALYNIVDSIFVSQIGEYALTAVSLAFPVQNLMIAAATGTGVGINAFLSMKLGQKDQESVNKTATNGIFLILCSFIVFFLLGLIFIPTYFKTQTNDPLILAASITYTRIVVLMSFGIFGTITLNRLLQACGKTVYSMIIQMIGVVINIALDPILIFGLFGFPRLEVAGAAIATVIGQMASLAVAIYFNLRHNHEIHLSFKKFRPDKQIIARIYTVGLPSIILVSIGSIMMYAMNMILATFSSTAIAVFGIFFRLYSFAFMPVIGLTGGMISIIAYNYGAKNRERISKAIVISTSFAVAIMLSTIIAFQLFPAQLLGLFNPSEAMLQIGIPALRIMSISFLSAGVCITFSSVFQALGNGVLSMIVSIVRQLIFLLPSAWFLSQTKELINVWWAFPLAEMGSLILCVLFMIYINKKLLSKIQN